MPPSAVSNRPALLWNAPVKAPFTWPNSSDSSSVSGIAAQFTTTNGRSWRSPPAWIARATISLPVPLSPLIRTLALLSATCEISSKTRCIEGPLPMMLRSRSRCRSSLRRRRFSLASSFFSSAFSTTSLISSTLKGFVM